MAVHEVRVSPGEDLTPHLIEGAVLRLLPGVHRAPLRIGASVSLLGEDGAILDAERRGPVLRIDADGVEVRLENLILQRGSDRSGSGVVLAGYSTLLVRDCAVRDNTPDEGGGSGLRVARGWVTAENCRFAAGNDVYVGSIGEATLRSCAIEGDLRALDGATVLLEGGVVSGRLIVRGTTTRAPHVKLAGVAVAKIENSEEVPGSIEIVG